MIHRIARTIAQKILARADVRINGQRPWDITVHDERLYLRVLLGGTLALGEAYMDGWWDTKKLDEFSFHILRVRMDKKIFLRIPKPVYFLKNKLLNRQKGRRRFKVAKQHYDAGNDLYERTLGPTMGYTCGYWKDAQTLDEAQTAKMDLACRKLGLEPGQKVLDIGCGWGNFAKHAAENYGVSVTGVTISKEQLAYAKKLCADLPIEFRFQDYKDIQGTFDRIVSFGMFEHVGHKNYRTYMEVAERCLADGGLFLLHSIVAAETSTNYDPWFEKYIFPNSMLPSMAQIAEAAEKLFVMEDAHNFGADYDMTLMAWHANFKAHWPELQSTYGERFRRMWTYYLLMCAGSFRARRDQLYQIVLSKGGVPGGYRSIR